MSGCGDLGFGDCGRAAGCAHEAPTPAEPLGLLRGALALGDTCPLAGAVLANDALADLCFLLSRMGVCWRGDCGHAISERGVIVLGDRGLAAHGNRALKDPRSAEPLVLLRGAHAGSMHVAAVELQLPL